VGSQKKVDFDSQKRFVVCIPFLYII